MRVSFGNIRLWLIVFTVNLISLLCGMFLTWTSPILPKLSSYETIDQNPLNRVITANEQSWIAALSSMGGIIGPPICGLISEKFGRKISIASIHVPNLIAALTAAFGKNIWFYYVSRLVAGMSMSSAMALGAIYFSEIAENHNRGILYCTTSIFINLGTLLTYCIGPYTSIMVFNLILGAISLLGILLTLLVVPESPYYLVQYGKLEMAKQTLADLRNGSDITAELKLVQENVLNIKNDGVFAIFQTKASRKALVISVVLTCLQQFSGINIIYSYTQTIFDRSGSNLSSHVSSILVGVAQFVTICLIPLSVDRFGRKKLLIFASSGLMFTLATLGTFYWFQNNSNYNTSSINWLPLVCLILFFAYFNCGLGGLPFLIMSELFPLNVRSSGSSVVSVLYWFTGFIMTFYYNRLNDVIGDSGSFYLFSVCMACYACYVFLFVPETKGKSLQQINDKMNA
ncbi:facilitated trehalose transporter Tret1-like [Rhynchophorus ferrugineus]|uniref:facilitated trehalose transporter Tret1-like n=1 Tax=Rhynchophorus ferrugineus TaxID=354439 RepID=UPI003FCDA7FA